MMPRAKKDRVMPHLVRAQNALRREDDAYLAGLLEQAIVHRTATIASGMPRTKGPPLDKRVAKALKYMIDNISDRRLTLADLASAAAMSVFHFARAFRDGVGVPPRTYLRQRRLELARELLAYRQGMPIAAVGLACGFSTQSHFTAAFTAEYGISPGKFRKQAAQQQGRP